MSIYILDCLDEGISVGSWTNVFPEFHEDYDLGGIRYSELFSKLSIESYELLVE